MKLEVDMFIRTKDGIIAKIEDLRHLDFHDHLYDTIYCDKIVRQEYGDGFEQIYPIDRDIIKKASFNIIDLIEVGDYVNGEYMQEHYLQHNRIEHTYNSYWYENDIKEILTHEQYEANAYRIGDE